MSDDALIARSDLAEMARLRTELRDLRAAYNQLERSRDAERVARQRVAAVVNAARIACVRSLFPGRGVLVAALAVYDDAVVKTTGA